MRNIGLGQRAFALLLASLVVGPVIPAMVAAAAEAERVTVHQVGRAFSAAALSVSRGQVVRFVNEDSFAHNIFIDAPSFRYESGLQPAGSAKDITFNQPGSFTVLCAIHPLMELTVDVQ